MANLLTRKEIANLIGRKQAYVGMYVYRGKLIEDSNKKIDTDHPINKAWIAKNTVRSFHEVKEDIKVKEEKKQKRKAKPVKELPDDFMGIESISLENISVNTIDALKKKKEIHRIEADTKLKELELLRKKALILPLDFVIDWAGRNLRGVFGETNNFGDSIIEDICNELGASIEIKLRFKKQFRQGFQEVLKNGIKNQEPEAMEFAKEYALMSKW